MKYSRKKLFSTPIYLGILLSIVASPLSGKETSLENLDVSRINVGWGSPRKNQSVSQNPLGVAGQIYENGIGVHAPGYMVLELEGKASRFNCLVGIDDQVGNRGEVRLVAYDDNLKVIGRSEIIKGGEKAISFQIDLTGKKRVIIEFDANGENAYDHLNLLNPSIKHT